MTAGFVAGQKIRASELNAGQPQFARMSSDVVIISSTTYVDATGLVLSLEANAAYSLDGFLLYQTATAADIKFILIGPTGAGGVWGIHGLQQAAANSDDDFEGFALPGIGPTNQIGLGGAGTSTDVWGHLKGLITTGATAGTLQLQFAQVTSTASNTRMKAVSHMSLARIS